MIYWRALLLGRCTSSIRCTIAAPTSRMSTPRSVKPGKFLPSISAEDRLQVDEPWDYDRLSGNTQDRIIKWMRENMK